MAKAVLPGSALAAMMGVALIAPVLVAWFETGVRTGLGIGFVAAGGGLILGGVVGMMAGFRQGPTGMPSGVRAAVATNLLVLGFLVLEFSDRSVRQDGKLFYWTTFLLPPAMFLFAGLVAGRPWSWWAARAVAGLGVLWFLGFLVIIPFAPLQADGVPTPWYGRVYMAGVTIAFTLILAGAFRSLGRPEARSYFSPVPPEPFPASQPPEDHPDLKTHEADEPGID